ncbi:hypothetical protein STEG23_002946, partial [Scotinomys teguina]
MFNTKSGIVSFIKAIELLPQTEGCENFYIPSVKKIPITKAKASHLSKETGLTSIADSILSKLDQQDSRKRNCQLCQDKVDVSLPQYKQLTFLGEDCGTTVLPTSCKYKDQM